MAEVAESMGKRNLETTCAYCGKCFWTWTAMVKRGMGLFCSRECAAKGKTNNRNYWGENNPNWKGGISQNRQDGYRRKLADKERHPEKHEARELVQREIRSGRMSRGEWEVCGMTNAHAHHDDYAKPLDVRWLCPVHHREHHAQTA